jgi:hypothetical protein
MEEHDEFAAKTTLVRATQRSRFGADGILRQVIIPETEFMADDARETLALHVKQIGGKKLRILINTSGVPVSTAQVRDSFSRPDTVTLVSAVALLVNTPALTRMLRNLSLALKREQVPIKFFGTEEAALQWLQSFPA